MGVSLYKAAQVKNIDRCAIEQCGVDGYGLMVQAGEAAFSSLLSRWPNVRQLIVLCGGGNNGGDGLVIARLAVQHEIAVKLVLTSDPDALKGEAKQAADDALQAGLQVIAPADIQWTDPEFHSSEIVVVDALLGTGLNSDVSEPYAGLISQANDSNLPILAVDVPSGLNASTGAIQGCSIKAAATITMIEYKQGLFTGAGPVVCGEISLAQLNLPQQARASEAPIASLESWKEIQHFAAFGPRQLDSHKGHFGHVMIVGGDLGCGGAISLAAGAALKSGAGLVSVATRPEHVPAVLARYPEAMVHGVQSGQDLQTLLDRADVIVIGPGLGQSYWGEQLLQQVMATHVPVLLDADALNILAKGRISHNLAERISVITPHPAEAARLLKSNSAVVQADRFKAAKNLSKKLSSSVVLKGVGSLISTRDMEPDEAELQATPDIKPDDLKPETLTSICQDGNAGMASGGMGDVLSGIMGSLMAQRLNPHNDDAHFANEATFNQALHDLVVSAVCLHSAAADLAVKEGQSGMLASDVIESIRYLLK